MSKMVIVEIILAVVLFWVLLGLAKSLKVEFCDEEEYYKYYNRYKQSEVRKK